MRLYLVGVTGESREISRGVCYYDGGLKSVIVSESQSMQITRTQRCIFRCGDCRNYVQEDYDTADLG